MVSDGFQLMTGKKKENLVKRVHTPEVAPKQCMVAETLFFQHIILDFFVLKHFSFQN